MYITVYIIDRLIEYREKSNSGRLKPLGSIPSDCQGANSLDEPVYAPAGYVAIPTFILLNQFTCSLVPKPQLSFLRVRRACATTCTT